MLKGHSPAPGSYRAVFEGALADLPGAGDAELRDARRAAFDHFEAMGLPGAKAEAWKYTPLTSLLPGKLAAASGGSAVDPATLAPFRVADGLARLVFVDGVLSDELSDIPSAENGVSVCRLSDAFAEDRAWVLERLPADGHDRSLDALNLALLRDGCVLRVGSRAIASAPVEILHVLTATGNEAAELTNLCHLVDLEDGAEAHVVETTVCMSGTTGVINLLNRCRLGDGARLTHERMQVGGSDGTVLARSSYDISADARLTHNVVTLGGRLVRSEIGARLGGREIEARFNGLYAVGTGQHADNALQIRHAAPGSMSDQAYRGVLSGRARAAFAGQIVVERPAQKTNAYQSNNNLLLSPDAEINTKPELEIYADDVKCSHGATAGEIDESELFYLRARGLDAETARSLLTFAFAGEVLERLVDPSFAATARRELLSRLPGGAELKDLMS